MEISGSSPETLQESSSKIKSLEQRSIQEKISRNAKLPINRLSIEIFLRIITSTFVWSPNHPRRPYPYIVFSWVCNHWRSTLLGKAVLWKTIVYNKRMTSQFSQELIRRSQTESLTIVLDIPIGEGLPTIYPKDINNRIKTLFLRSDRAPLSFSAFMLFFLNVENVFCHTPDHIPVQHFKTWGSGTHRLKALQISIGELKHLEMACQLQHLRWLRLTCTSSIPLLPLLEALQKLPHLEVLHLLPAKRPELLTTDTPIMTFPALKALVIVCCPILHLVTAPKLTYLDATLHPNDKNYGHFCGYDLCQLSHFYTDLCDYGFRYFVGSDRSINPKNIHRASHSNAIESTFDQIPTSYPCQFKIATEEDEAYLALIPPFSTFLGKATNLVEITLLTFELSEDAMQPELEDNEAKSFFAALKDYAAARRITVLSGTCFETFCILLGEETSPCPNLERITYTSGSPEDPYSSGYRDYEFSFNLHDCLQEMLKQRAEAGLKPLLELEIKAFCPVKSEVLERIGKLGIQFIQEKEESPLRSPGDSESDSE